MNKILKKAVLLCGGKGTRLYDNTRVTNKHLCRVWDKPMIEYPLDVIKQLGIEDVMVVTGLEHGNTIFNYLGSGKRYGLRFTFAVQDEAGGIAEALSLAEGFIADDNCLVILGDNIFDIEIEELSKSIYEILNTSEREWGATILLKEVADPQRFGVAEIVDNQVINIEEKPKEPKTNLAVTGMYVFDRTVFDKIGKCGYSQRGEKEISDVNNLYIQEGKMHYAYVNGFWSDAGTINSIRICDEYFYNKQMP